MSLFSYHKSNYLYFREFCLFMAFVFVCSTQVALADDDLESSFYGKGSYQKFSSIAAGHPVPENRSPGVTSIITSKDIERIGARRITDVLEYLPGVHVQTSRDGVKTVNFRGAFSEGNQQVLVMINGTSIRNAYFGGKNFLWDMPVKNISYIEVIRGPGSMLYGADATSGVINIVLKNGSELKGGDIGGFFGSDDTYEGWAQYGNKTGDWDYSLSLQGGSTNGNKSRIDRDAQTLIDQQFGTHVSNAPGYANNGRQDIDTRLDIGYQDKYRLRAGYQRFNDVETGVGASYALDKFGRNQVDIYTMDITAKNELIDKLSLNSKLFFYGDDLRTDQLFLPPGTLGGQLPQGTRSVSDGFVGSTGFAEQLDYTGYAEHNLIFGTGLTYSWGNPTRRQINYIVTPSFVQQIPLTDLDRLSPNTPLTKDTDRFNYYALVQDEWNFATDWYLTTGFRYDYYSDVADGFSPRVSVVWNVNPYLTTKLIYGRAFRPPSLFERLLPANPNTTLKPEITNTVEFQIENKWTPDLKTSTNAYWFELDNFISSNFSNGITPVSFTNNPKINGVGFEAEASYQATDTLSMTLNYSYHGISRTANTGLLPEHMAKGLLNWEFANGWFLGGQFDWIGERRRSANDSRKNLNDYFLFGVTLSTKIADPLEFTLRANNLLGSNARDPSEQPALLPGDIPVTGRSILGQVKWSF